MSVVSLPEDTSGVLPDPTGIPSPLVVERVCRDYKSGRGKKASVFRAVNAVSLRIEKGEIFALVGVNGAGKTTLVRMLATILAPTSGSISVMGIDALRYPRRARRHVGLVLGGDRGFYTRATVRDNLRFFADLAGVPGRERDRQISDILSRVRLSKKENNRVQELSRGQRQRLHIARALLGSPSLLLLDEPTIGLDPDVALEIRHLIHEVAHSGVGILLTSHSMSEVEQLATRLAVLESGEIRVSGGLTDVYRFANIQMASTFSVRPSPDLHPQQIESWFAPHAYVLRHASGADWKFTLLWHGVSERVPQPDGSFSAQKKLDQLNQSSEQVVAVFAAHGLERPRDLHSREVNLEDAFLAIAQGAQNTQGERGAQDARAVE